MAIVVSHNEIISKERIIVTYHPIGKKKNIYSLFCLKKSGGYSTMSSCGGRRCSCSCGGRGCGFLARRWSPH